MSRKGSDDYDYSEGRMGSRPLPAHQQDNGQQILMIVLGVILGALAIFPALMTMLGLAISEPSITILFGVIGGLLGFGSFASIRRSRRLGRAARYRKFLGGWAGCTLREMSREMNTTIGALKKDLDMLLQKGYLPGACLDKTDGIFFADRASYNDYVTERRARRRKEEQERREKERPVEPGFQGQANSFLRQVKEIKPEVDAPEAKEQVTIMEQTVSEIRDWVAAHPGSEPKVKRLSTYYLPTTLKLLRTYISVDDNPGPTAQNICRNITSNLQTFNKALHNMQDSLLDDTALDVSAEISVLESMLQQEGLTGDGFPTVAVRGDEDIDQL